MLLLTKNAMEDVVALYAGEIMEREGCCNCAACTADVITYALNRLPPRYYATPKGLEQVQQSLQNEYKDTVLAVLTEGARLIKSSPKHEAKR